MTLTDEEIRTIARVVELETCRRFHRWRDEDREEIRSDALLGIAKAIRSHDSDTVPLIAYAYLRARGEALDGIRRRSPLPRYQHGKGLTTQTAPQAALPARSLDDLVAHVGAEHMPDPHAEIPYQRVDDHLLCEDLLRSLTPRQHDTVVSHFWDSHLLREIAAVQGVSASAISQLITAALKTMNRKAAA